jgi:vacuolar-type H+-ATPase subunit I/STV1
MLAKEDITQIEALIEQIIARRPESINANVRYELDLRERTVRVEEELKHQRDLMVQGFEAMEKRFEQMDKRFEQVDKRLDQVDKQLAQSREEVNKRFEQVDKQLAQSREETNKRFEQMEKQFAQNREETNKRFEQIDRKFDEMGRRMDRFMFWSLGLTVSAALFVVNF